MAPGAIPFQPRPSSVSEGASITLLQIDSHSLVPSSYNSISDIVAGTNLAGHSPLVSVSPINLVPSSSSSTTAISGYGCSSNSDFQSSIFFCERIDMCVCFFFLDHQRPIRRVINMCSFTCHALTVTTAAKRVVA